MDKKNKIIIPSLFLLVLIVYLITLSPAVNFEDSGEFITTTYTLSIGHPPGYPLYIILGKLFSFLPFGSVEFKINFMSAFFSALSAVVLYILSFRIFKILKEKPYFISFFIVALYFLSSSLWDISLVAEVYTLNLFLVSLLLLIIEHIYFEKNPDTNMADMPIPYKSKMKYHYLFFYLVGLGTANHHTFLFICLIYLVFFIKNKTNKALTNNHYFKFGILFLLGASIYVYLPIRAGANPIINWGNPETVKDFLAVLFRKQYGDVGSELIPLGTFFKHILTVNPVHELFKLTDTKININHIPSVVILGTTIYLIYFGLKSIKNKSLKLFFILLFVLYSFFIVFLANAPEGKLFTLKVFFIPAWFSLYFILFYGLYKILKKNSLYFFPAFFIILFLINFKYQNKNNYYYTRDYVLNFLKNLTYRPILFTLKDNETFPTWNMRHIHQKRPDAAIVNLVLLSEQWYLDQITAKYPDLKIGLETFKGNFPKKTIRQKFLQSIINSNPGRDIYFISKDSTPEFKKFIDMKMNMTSSGMLYKLNYTPTPSQEFYEFENLKKDYAVFLNLLNNNNIESFKSKITYLSTQTKYVLQTVVFALLEYANGLFQYGFDNDSKYYYQYSIYINNIIGAGINNIYTYANIGNIAIKNGDKKNCIYFFKKGIELQPDSDLAKQMAMKIQKLTQLDPDISKIEKKETEGSREIKKSSVAAENYYSKGDYINALINYQKLVQLGSNNPVTYCNMGDCYFNMKDYNKAIEYYKKAIKSKKDYVTAYYNLGGCYLMLNQNAAAKTIWEAGLKYAPGDQRLLDALKKYF